MKYISQMGIVYRLTNSRYRLFLETFVREGSCPDVERFGKELGYIKNMTDLCREEAELLLEEPLRGGLNRRKWTLPKHALNQPVAGWTGWLQNTFLVSSHEKSVFERLRRH